MTNQKYDAPEAQAITKLAVNIQSLLKKGYDAGFAFYMQPSRDSKKGLWGMKICNERSEIHKDVCDSWEDKEKAKAAIEKFSADLFKCFQQLDNIYGAHF